MRYSTYLKKLKTCPFCDLTSDRILAENEKAILTYSQAPYHKYHLLVIPKKHTKNIIDLDWNENLCITALISTGIKALDKMGHNDCTVLVKDSQATGKSVPNHLHYHIIPGGVIKDISVRNKMRKMMNYNEEQSLRQDIERNITKGL